MRITLISFSVFLLGCESEVVPPTPPEPVPTISLTIEDTGVTEVWLRIIIADTVPERTFTIHRDGAPIDTATLLAADSVYADGGLVPKHQYLYQAFRTSNSVTVDSTEPVQAMTMDTTSHEFVWKTFEFGDHSSSVLYDAEIIEEDDIWVVGEIYLNDSTGQRDDEAYNLARWDGSTWAFVKVQFPQCNASGKEIGTSSYPGRSIHGFSPTDLWIAGSGSLVHWDGAQFVRTCMPIGYGERSILTLWGREGSLYWGGTNGYLAYDDGSGWQQMASQTTLDINDIHGTENVQAGETEILAVAARQFATLERMILRISGPTVQTVSDSGIPGSLQALWFKSDRKYYVVGNGIYAKRSLVTEDSWNDVDVTPYYLYGMGGDDINDVVACGTFGEVLHFNGVTWRSYQKTTGLSVGAYNRVAIKGNTLVAVGFDSPRAVVALGVRSTE